MYLPTWVRQREVWSAVRRTFCPLQHASRKSRTLLHGKDSRFFFSKHPSLHRQPHGNRVVKQHLRHGPRHHGRLHVIVVSTRQRFGGVVILDSDPAIAAAERTVNHTNHAVPHLVLRSRPLGVVIEVGGVGVVGLPPAKPQKKV